MHPYLVRSRERWIPQAMTIQEVLDFLDGLSPDTELPMMLVDPWPPDEDFSGERLDPGVSGVSLHLEIRGQTVEEFRRRMGWCLGEDSDGLFKAVGERWFCSDSERVYIRIEDRADRAGVYYVPFSRVLLEEVAGAGRVLWTQEDEELWERPNF